MQLCSCETKVIRSNAASRTWFTFSLRYSSKFLRSLLLTFWPEGVVWLHKHIHIYSVFFFLLELWSLKKRKLDRRKNETSNKTAPTFKMAPSKTGSTFWFEFFWYWTTMEQNRLFSRFFWTRSSYASTNKTLTAPEYVHYIGFKLSESEGFSLQWMHLTWFLVEK